MESQTPPVLYGIDLARAKAWSGKKPEKKVATPSSFTIVYEKSEDGKSIERYIAKT